MSDKLEVVITGRNGVSRIFKEVTDSAKTMGAGVEASSARSASALANWDRAAQKVGAAIGALALVTSRANAESEASHARLSASIEATGRTYEEFERQIQAAADAGLRLAFDDEDVQDALSTLTQATGDAATALRDLALVEDISRGLGVSLASSARIVALAEQGRVTQLARLGIVLDANATKEEALAALQARYAGQAEAYAATTKATWDRVGNAIENRAEQVGAALSGISGPLIAISSGGSILGTLGGILKETGVGTKILSAAMGPAGLAGAAVVAGAGLYLLSQRASEWEKAADAAAGTTLALNDQIGRLAAGGQARTAGALKEVSDEWGLLAKSGAETVKKLDEIDQQIFDIQLKMAEVDYTGDLQKGLDTYDALEAQLEALRATEAELQKFALSSDAIDSITEDISNLFAKPSIDARKAGEDIAWYFDQFEQGLITQEQLVSWIDESAQDWTRYSTAVVEAASAQEAYNRASFETASTLVANSTLLGNLKDVQDASIIASGRQFESLKLVSGALAEEEVATRDVVIPTQDLTAAMDRFVTVSADATAFLALQAENANAAASALSGYASALGQVAPIDAGGAARFAAGANAAGTALGDAFRVAVGNTNAIGQQAQQTADWAMELINVKGETGKIDDLLARGVITTEEYNKAQAAGTKIFNANAAIQDDILQIQTKQAPIIGQLVREQQDYMDALADLPANQQALRLAYMDTETSAKGLAAMELAAAAAAGELGAAGEATATKMITAAAEADPYLRKMLQDMGLISVGADGTITVNFGSVEDAGASLDDLKGVLEDILELLGQAFDIDIDSNAADAVGPLQELKGLLDGLDDRHVTTTVTTIDQHFQVTQTDYVPGRSDVEGRLRLAHGGVIPAAHGAVLVGEFGPELLRRSGGGGFVLPTGATKSAMGGQGPTVQVIVQGNVFGISDLTEQVTRELVPAIQLAFDQYYNGMGIR